MNFGMQQKIKVLDLMANASAVSAEQQARQLAGSSALKSSKFQLKKFRENAAILENYRQQMAGLSPKKPVSKKQAEKAWTAMGQICDSVLPLMANAPAANQADRAAMQTYQMMLTEYKNTLAKGDHYEKQYQSIPDAFAPSMGSGAVPEFNSADVLHLTDNLAAGQPMELLNRLSANPLLTNTPKLRFVSLAQNVQALNDYHLQIPGDVAGGAKKAFADLRENGGNVLANIDLLMAKEKPDSQNYQDLQEYKLLVTDCCYTVSLADQRALQRQFDEQNQELTLMTDALADILDPGKAEIGMEDDDEPHNDPESVYARTIRDSLTGYVLTGASENAFAIEFERLNTEIQTKKAVLPTGMAERFSGYRTPEELARLHTLAQQELAQPGSTGDPLINQYASSIDLFIDMRLSQAKQAILVSQNQAQYTNYAAQEQERIKKGPDQVLRSSLGVMAKQMNGMHKYWFNSTSYNALNKALNEAAAGGDPQKLLQAAQNYIKDKQNGNPSSENGIRRLAMAKAIVAMLTKANEKKAFAASLPEPQKPSAEPVSVSEEEQIDMNFNEIEVNGPDSVEMNLDNISNAEYSAALKEEEKKNKQVQREEYLKNEQKFKKELYSQYQPKTDKKAIMLPKGAPTEETKIVAKDTLFWPDTKDGFSMNRDVIRSALQTRLIGYPPEKRQEIADKFYELVNRHLSGHDLNGYANFINSAHEVLFEEHDGQPPLMDPKDDILLHTLGQLIVHNSDFIPRQVKLYHELKEKDPHVNPFSQPNALTANVPQSNGIQTANELYAKRVLDMALGVNVNGKGSQTYALHHAIYSMVYYGSEKDLKFLAHKTPEYMQELSDRKDAFFNEYMTEGKIHEYLKNEVQQMNAKDLPSIKLTSKNLFVEKSNSLEY